MSRGADAHQRNDDGLESPLILARRRNDVDLIRLLTTSTEKLMFGGGNMGGFESLLESPAVPVSPADALPLRASLSTRECTICFCDEGVDADPSSRIVRLERCGHGCCLSCMSDFMQAQVDAHFSSAPNPVIRCFAKGCSESVSYRDFERFAPRETCVKYQSRLTTAALRLMKDFSWCTKCESGGFVSRPTPSSSSSSSSSAADRQLTCDAMPLCSDVQCDQCSHSYCSTCREDAHPTMTCAQKYELVMATDHSITERLTAKILRRVTKPCPQCAALTLRDGGCSHMTCRLCQFAWCWLCGGPYAGRYTFNSVCPCGS